jgi:hypothetical protein
VGRRVTGDKLAKPGDNATDEELLKQRLAAAVNVLNERSTTGFRRRRSSGLLFQVRRRIGRDAAPATLMGPEPPSI